MTRVRTTPVKRPAAHADVSPGRLDGTKIGRSITDTTESETSRASKRSWSPCSTEDPRHLVGGLSLSIEESRGHNPKRELFQPRRLSFQILSGPAGQSLAVNSRAIGSTSRSDNVGCRTPRGTPSPPAATFSVNHLVEGVESATWGSSQFAPAEGRPTPATPSLTYRSVGTLTWMVRDLRKRGFGRSRKASSSAVAISGSSDSTSIVLPLRL